MLQVLRYITNIIYLFIYTQLNYEIILLQTIYFSISQSLLVPSIAMYHEHLSFIYTLFNDH